MEHPDTIRVYQPKPVPKDIPLKYLSLAFTLLMLAACQQESPRAEEPAKKQAAPAAPSTFADAKGDLPPLSGELASLPLQLALDRLGFSPGVLDGKEGQSLKIALMGFQSANDLPETGVLDAATKAALGRSPTVPATRLVTIPTDFAGQKFYPALPKDAADKAELPALGYQNLMEALAERFHTTPATLVALNAPNAPIGAGQTIVVPNIADAPPASVIDDKRGWAPTLTSLGIAADQPAIARIEVDKSAGWLRGYGEDDKLIVQYPVTMGSAQDPLPLGNWTVKGVARNPDYNFDPKLPRNVSNSEDKQIFKPGPNSPVGVVWIDLSKEHYGIHGTPDPATIGRAESNGCVRLTNWDAARLAQMVKPGTKVLFKA
jgi:lipoprotein-anchoring transpeptidase ErfK/SrfK